MNARPSFSCPRCHRDVSERVIRRMYATRRTFVRRRVVALRLDPVVVTCECGVAATYYPPGEQRADPWNDWNEAARQETSR